LNSFLESFGTGAYHCGIEVYGKEWSFHQINSGTGVFECAPRSCTQHTHKQSVVMGVTSLSKEEVERLINRLRREWPGRGYEVLTRNCCHFSNTLSVRLGTGEIPRWCTSLAAAGASVKTFFDGVSGTLSPTLLLNFVSGAPSLAEQEKVRFQSMTKVDMRSVVPGWR